MRIGVGDQLKKILGTGDARAQTNKERLQRPQLNAILKPFLE